MPFFSLPNPPCCSDEKFNELSAIFQLHYCSTKHLEPHMIPAEISTMQIYRLFMLHIHNHTVFFFRRETYFGHRFVSVLTCPKYNQTSQKQQGSWETQITPAVHPHVTVHKQFNGSIRGQHQAPQSLFALLYRT